MIDTAKSRTARRWGGLVGASIFVAIAIVFLLARLRESDSMDYVKELKAAAYLQEIGASFTQRIVTEGLSVESAVEQFRKDPVESLSTRFPRSAVGANPDRSAWVTADSMQGDFVLGIIHFHDSQHGWRMTVRRADGACESLWTIEPPLWMPRPAEVEPAAQVR